MHPSTHEILHAFLGAHVGEFYCGECLAGLLGLHSAPVTVALLGLRRAPAFEVREAVCSRCGRGRSVIRRPDDWERETPA